MRRRIAVGERPITGARHDGAVVDDDAADRDFAAFPGRARFLQRHVHERCHRAVMAGLVPAIHVFGSVQVYKDVDARHKLAAGPATSGRTRLAGHDEADGS